VLFFSAERKEKKRKEKERKTMQAAKHSLHQLRKRRHIGSNAVSLYQVRVRQVFPTALQFKETMIAKRKKKTRRQ
jgi:hypothetical protein